jgi:hypothetical protein
MDMRRFLNIVQAGQSPNPTGKKVLSEAARVRILKEAQDYAAIFSPIMKMLAMLPSDYQTPTGISIHEETTNSINAEIAWAKRILRKSDRIVWFLRIARVSLAERVYDAARMLDRRNPETEQKYEPALRVAFEKLKEDLKAKIGTGMARETYVLGQSLEHFLSLPIPAIQNIVWDNQNPELLIQQFRKLEREWQARRSQLIPHDPADGQVVMSFPDGMMWVLLPRGYCSAEADAMGHCGNAGAKQGERILSLRRKVEENGEVFWRPSLTFILDAEGRLGEMKGRANNKPDRKYHQHILALLMNRDLIKGIKGGGYKPEANFAVGDLTEAERERLFDARPELANASWYLKRKGFDETFREMVENEFEAHEAIETGLEDYWDGQELRVKKFRDWREIYEDYGDRTAKHYAEEDVVYGFDFDAGNDAIEFFIDHTLPDKTWNLIVQYLIREYNLESDGNEEAYGDDYDADSVSDMIRLMEEQGDPLYDALETAVRDGKQYGTEKEIIDALESGIKNPKLEYGHFVFEGHGTDFTYDVPVYLQLTLKEISSLLDNPGELETIAYNGWIEKETIKINVPYYGFDGTDDDVALDTFYEHAPDEFNTRRKFEGDPYQMSDEQLRAEIAELAPIAYAKEYVTPSKNKIKEVIEQSQQLSGHRLANLLFDVRRKVSNL